MCRYLFLKYEVEAEVGFSVEYLCKKYGSLEPIADAIREGKILGVVNMVGCNNPKVLYEKAILDVCDVLLKNNVLIITNGCASFPLMKMGYCQTSEFAYSKAGEGLREFLKPDMPPVWHVGRMYRQHQIIRNLCRHCKCIRKSNVRKPVRFCITGVVK